MVFSRIIIITLDENHHHFLSSHALNSIRNHDNTCQKRKFLNSKFLLTRDEIWAPISVTAGDPLYRLRKREFIFQYSNSSFMFLLLSFISNRSCRHDRVTGRHTCDASFNKNICYLFFDFYVS